MIENVDFKILKDEWPASRRVLLHVIMSRLVGKAYALGFLPQSAHGYLAFATDAISEFTHNAHSKSAMVNLEVADAALDAMVHQADCVTEEMPVEQMMHLQELCHFIFSSVAAVQILPQMPDDMAEQLVDDIEVLPDGSIKADMAYKFCDTVVDGAANMMRTAMDTSARLKPLMDALADLKSEAVEEQMRAYTDKGRQPVVATHRMGIKRRVLYLALAGAMLVRLAEQHKRIGAIKCSKICLHAVSCWTNDLLDSVTLSSIHNADEELERLLAYLQRYLTPTSVSDYHYKSVEMRDTIWLAISMLPSLIRQLPMYIVDDLLNSLKVVNDNAHDDLAKSLEEDEDIPEEIRRHISEHREHAGQMVVMLANTVISLAMEKISGDVSDDYDDDIVPDLGGIDITDPDLPL